MIIGALLAFALSLAMTPLASAALGRIGVLDHPNARSSHDRPVVRGGGVAPVVVAVTVGAVLLDLRNDLVAGVLIATASFALIGLFEDLRGIPALRRLVFQLIASGLASWWLLDELGGPSLWTAVFSVGVVVWIVAYVNAFNFMDGINGISAVQIVAAGATWIVVGAFKDAEALGQLGAIIAAATLGFLPFNFPRASVFLGDVGSYGLGAWLAAGLVLGFRAGLPPEAVLAPLALYLADTGTTIVKRVVEGETWHLPHRRHAYQRLVRSGWSHTRTTLVVAAFMAGSSAFGLAALGPLWLRAAGDVALVATLVAYLNLPKIVEGTRRPAIA